MSLFHQCPCFPNEFFFVYAFLFFPMYANFTAHFMLLYLVNLQEITPGMSYSPFPSSSLNRESVFSILWISPSSRNGSPYSCNPIFTIRDCSNLLFLGYDIFSNVVHICLIRWFFHCISSCTHFLSFFFFL
jgi:hypothetical protein